MVMKMLLNTCNMCIHDFPDMNALGLWTYMSGKSLTLPLSIIVITDITLNVLGLNLEQCLKDNKQYKNHNWLKSKSLLDKEQ